MVANAEAEVGSSAEGPAATAREVGVTVPTVGVPPRRSTQSMVAPRPRNVGTVAGAEAIARATSGGADQGNPWENEAGARAKTGHRRRRKKTLAREIWRREGVAAAVAEAAAASEAASAAAEAVAASEVGSEVGTVAEGEGDSGVGEADSEVDGVHPAGTDPGDADVAVEVPTFHPREKAKLR